MSEPDRERVQAIFLAVIKLPPDAREDHLDRVCGGDEALKQAVLRMVAADEGAGEAGFLRVEDTPVLESGSQERRIGNFRLIRLLGAGGMGSVFEAVQEPLERTVALKVVRASFVSAGALRRFDEETRFLAKLQHPNIAQIFEAGTADTPAGPLTYYAMELVAGARSLTNYALVAKLSIAERLQLFRQVCDAVTYAHEQGVIHRDLKPANILVDQGGAVKIVDFGIARSTDADMQATQQTAMGDILGTLAYMSPEQCAGRVEQLDHRTDVYSLGVVLYELLCGQLPYDLRKAAIQEAVRVVSEAAPQPPSALSRKLGGDIEIIALKAIEKNPKHRYQSVHAFATDIQRYVEQKGILARRPSWARRAVGFSRRYRVPLGFMCLALLVVLLGAAYLLFEDHGRSSITVLARRADTGAAVRGAEVYLRPIEIRTRKPGNPVSIGQTPVYDKTIAPGYYRIVVVERDYGFSELVRDVRLGKHVEATALLRPEATVTQGMVRIAPGPAKVGMDISLEWAKDRTVSLEGFWIDVTEVSNADYKAYLDATGAAMPPLWGGKYREDWADLPVVGVDWYEARAYAEWAGKRLPSDLEWERAGRGANGRLYPWGDDPGDTTRRANTNHGGRMVWKFASDDDALRRAYAQSVIPVASLPEGMIDQTPDGVLHMLGNVGEWTESMVPADLPGGDTGHRLERIIKGGNWGRRPEDGWNLGAFMTDPVGQRYLSGGFRCARSIAALGNESTE